VVDTYIEHGLRYVYCRCTVGFENFKMMNIHTVGMVQYIEHGLLYVYCRFTVGVL